jgi:hypothetical protein
VWHHQHRSTCAPLYPPVCPSHWSWVPSARVCSAGRHGGTHRTGWGVAVELEGADAAVGWWERCSESGWELCSVGVQGVCVREGASASHRKTSLVTAHARVHPPHPTS